MTAYTFPRGRSAKDDIQTQISVISKNPLIDGLMRTVSGLLAVLNENRQIVALNELLLQELGVQGLREVIGLRPGEALGCMVAQHAQQGCGTTQACMGCGAAIAIATSLALKRPEDRVCSIVAEKAGETKDYYFRVHACPIVFENEQFILLFMQDISRHQELASLERVFFHDINNLLSGLVTASDLLAYGDELNDGQMVRTINLLARRLAQEVAMQRLLVQHGFDDFSLNKEHVFLTKVIGQLLEMVANHPAKASKSIEIVNPLGELRLYTDVTLLLKVLGNMVINALEATEDGHFVTVTVQRDGGLDNDLLFTVWNRAAIPPEVAGHMFQRNYSTKSEFGRGLGTYSMKLFGEKLLGGKVFFKSNPEEGTTFAFSFSGK